MQKELETNRPVVLILGDSLAAALYPGLKVMESRLNFALLQYTAGPCPPFMNDVMNNSLGDRCRRMYGYFLKKIRIQKPDIILLASHWQMYWDFVPQELPKFIDALKATGVKNIVLIGDGPYWRPTLAIAMYRYYFKIEHVNDPFPHRMKFALDERPPVLETGLRQISSELRVGYFSEYNLLCNSDGCLTRVDDNTGELIVADEGHLSLSGSSYVARMLAPELQVFLPR